MLAVLIPEASIPLSAIDPIYRLVTSLSIPEYLITLLLDKCEATLLEHKSLLYACVAAPEVGVRIIERLLNGLETVKICAELRNALYERDQHSYKIDKVATMLFERCDVKMTDKNIDEITYLKCLSQILSHLVSRGIEYPPLSPR